VSEPQPDLHALLGSYARIVGTAMEGVAVVTEKVLEAFQDADVEYARELALELDRNVAHWRKSFNFLKELP
jgi:hypothetical protein